MCVRVDNAAPDNPLRLDPSRTNGIVEKFRADLVRRLSWLKGEVYHAVGVENAWGFSEASVVNAPPGKFRFETDASKLSSFVSWFQDQLDTGVLTVDENYQNIPWTEVYVDSAYRKGVVRAYMDTRSGYASSGSKEKLMALGAKQEFLLTAFAAPVTLSKISLLGTRSFESLKGITGTMSSDMARILANGMSHGYGPLKIAKQLTDQIGELTRRRALMIARTEIIHAHAEGQLDAFERMGVNELGLLAEWRAAAGACPLCADMAGRTFTVAEARGLIPLHPNCRCTWAPYSAIFSEVKKKSGSVANSAQRLPGAWWAWWRAA
jgi:SPP1 gp7 family putative phage head morphogenesis protein